MITFQKQDWEFKSRIQDSESRIQYSGFRIQVKRLKIKDIAFVGEFGRAFHKNAAAWAPFDV